MQTEKLAIHKRFSSDMREIWGLQLRLEKRSGRSAMKLLEHQRFRAGYDFLLLRCESGELDASVGQWWTDFIEGDAAARESLLSQGGKDRAPKKRRRRSSNAKSRRPGDGIEGGASTVEGSARDNREERDVRDVRYGDENGGQRDD
jgi:poly(A) polymerase